MMRCPHDIFRHILSYKDPRYERVRSGGDPFGKTPTRVWYTLREYRKSRRYPLIVRRCSGDITVYNERIPRDTLFWNETEDEFRVESTSRLELRMNPDMFDSGDEGADYKCPRKLADVSLQCEACGPDLELYDMLR